MGRLISKKHQALQGESHWIPLSDLMTGLMMIFLLISVLYMMQVQAQAKKTKSVAVLYDKLKRELYSDLLHEFRDDLPRWGAELRREDLVLQFKEPDVLFTVGSSELRERFKQILDGFFPRYVAILTSPRYRDSIMEVRIEGHTSSFWNNGADEQLSYMLNMELSQARTRSTLGYIMTMPALRGNEAWLRRYLTANGLSFSRPVVNKDGSENILRSQRVEFRVVTNAEERIARILESP